MKVEQLENLTKEQLIWLVNQSHHIEVIISEELVRESKKEVSSEHVIDKIRELLKNEYVSLNNEHLSDYIDMRMGKLTKEDYKKRMLE